MIFSDKLFLLLSRFSKQDLNRFRKMVDSPYYNEREELCRLFSYIHPLLKKESVSAESLSKQSVFEAVWPGQLFHDGRLRHLASDLTQLAFQFIILQEREKRPWEDLLDLQEGLQDPALKKHSDGTDRHIELFLNTQKCMGTAYYFTGFRAYRTWYSIATHGVRKSNTGLLLSASEQYLDIFYVVQKLKFYVEWLTLKATRSTTDSFSEPEGFWQQAEQFRQVPLVSLYLNMIRCLENMDKEVYFFALLEQLEQAGEQLTAGDCRDAYQVAQNYCAFKINSGDAAFYQQMFGIYQKMLASGLLLEDGVLAEGNYKNVITSGLRTGAFAWVEQFINDYSGLLPVHLRDNARTFNLANLYSHQRQHQKVIELLQNVEYSDVMYALSSKIILIRTYYDLGEFLTLDSLLESFRIYIRRNQLISNNLKSEYLKFIHFVRQLTRLDLYDKAQLARLKQKVAAATSATPKKWLQEKIEALEQGKKPRRKA